MSQKAEPTIPLGRIRALLNAYEREIEQAPDTAESRVYGRVCRDLRNAISPEVDE
jgi:hypothetical protein